VKAEAVANRARKNAACVISLPALEQVPFAAFQATADSITATGKEAHSLVNIWLKSKDARPIVYNQGTNNIINNPLLLYIMNFTAHSSQTTLHLLHSITVYITKTCKSHIEKRDAYEAWQMKWHRTCGVWLACCLSRRSGEGGPTRETRNKKTTFFFSGEVHSHKTYRTARKLAQDL
jgi:hypothetical protein